MIMHSAASTSASPAAPPPSRPARRRGTPQRGETVVQRRRRVQFQWRLRSLIRSIPKAIVGRDVARFYAYAVLVASLSNRQRRNVVLPWQPRPLDPKQHPHCRVPRGRLSNPTVLR